MRIRCHRDSYFERAQPYPPFKITHPEDYKESKKKPSNYDFRAVERFSSSFERLLRIAFEALKTTRIFRACLLPISSTYARRFPAIKDTSRTLRVPEIPEGRIPLALRVSVMLEKFVGKFGWSCEPRHACARGDRSMDPSGIPERGLKEVILYRGEHVVARGATASSTARSTRTPTTGARRRDDAGQRLQSSSCFGPLNSSWEMKPFLSLSSCWKISSTSLS